ncbi:DoxX family membrane protein [Nocardioides kongjuensis]|uniref:Putative membrane protein YphA (DoxX/SURF4 family) n=1 Tax=Nocardioides kongjuensis TaxID=349522 RepID=A0A852S3Q7_9ACTN|nr:DoxX family membrane protein [Nocardioides kongjuensis]NYD33412.1 putative membrane protein YphA (DoxX/SURF4 family) [Nocardioides kongjuensis]
MRTTARRLARLLTGTTYVLLGVDALRSPGGRVAAAGPMLATLRGVVPIPDDDTLVVRANGAAQAAGGAAIAAGVLPRTAALGLIGSMVPTTLAGHAFWKVEDPAARKQQQVQLLKNLAMIGGLIQVAIDRDD